MGIFRAYDIRGIYGKDLTDEVAFKIGKALGTFLNGREKVCVGFDTRPSSPKLFRNFVSGLTSTGCDVISLGLIPNPLAYFYAWKNKTFGCAITASVDGDEFTLIEDENNYRKLVKVGEFIDRQLKEGNFRNFKVLSFDPEIGKVEFKKIKGIFKHKINEDVLEIKLAYGRSVKVTSSHSLYTYRNGKVISIPTSQLEIGDIVPVPLSIPNLSRNVKINLVKELYPYRESIGKIILQGEKILEINRKRMLNSKRVKKVKLKNKGKLFLFKKRKEFGISRKEASIKCGISPMTIQRIEIKTNREFIKIGYLRKYLSFLGIDEDKFLGSKEFVHTIDFFKGSWKDGRTLSKIKLSELSLEEVKSIKNCTLYCAGGKGKIKNIIKITPELARLIGYYVAEGNLENCRIRFTFGPRNKGHENIAIEDIKKIIKKAFGINPHCYEKKNKTIITVDNLIIYSLFAKIFGFEKKDARTKKIPDIIFNLSKKNKIEFLRGLFLGDGTLTPQFMKFTTASFELLNGLSYLLLEFGIKLGIKNSEKIFEIIISNFDSMKELKRVWSSHWNTKNVKERNNREKYHVYGNLILLPIKEIRKVNPSSCYVYDFSVEGETFIAGVGGVCCHNSHNPKEWNGFKFIEPNGTSFIENNEKIKKIFESEIFLRGRGKIKEEEILEEYTNFLKRKLGTLKGKVAIDFLGGAGIRASNVLKDLGLDIIPLHDKPDPGLYGFHRLEPWGKLLDTLKKVVKKERADFGVAFDCDADRSVFVDSLGNFINPSIINAIFIKDLLKKKRGKIILTYDCASELEDIIRRNRGKVLWYRVGHGFIEKKLLEENALFAGEQSSHFYFNIFYPFSDGILSTLYLTKILNETGRNLEELAKEIEINPIEKLYINTKSDEGKFKIVEKLKKEFPKSVDIMDGFKIWFNEKEWVLIRASQTLPEINLCVQAKNEKRLKEIVRKYSKIIKEKIRELNG